MWNCSGLMVISGPGFGNSSASGVELERLVEFVDGGFEFDVQWMENWSRRMGL